MPDPVALSTTPVDLVAAASLTLNTKYVVEADTSESGDTPVYFKEADTAPADATRNVDQTLGHRKKMIIKPSTKMWATTPVGRKLGRLLIAESV